MYEAMARRYRPAQFAAVIGQEHIAQTLCNAITADRVAHAYLFCGPHGCGKTSMARIFAKALSCQRGPTVTPCDACDSCRSIMRGQDVDVHEIDGASNNGVEQVRALREQAGYVPARGRYKIYIIDEVHMLSMPAFNALLKTLEEPPPHVKFILATTEPHKLPETVLSRCQRFDFRLVPAPRLAEFLRQVVAQEKAKACAEALDAVAAFAGGSVRDSLVLLDQLLSYATGEVTRADVERVRGVAPAESVAGLYCAIAQKDVKRAMAIVDEICQRGVNSGDFLDQLVDYGRDLLLLVATGNEDGVSAYGPARAALVELSRQTSLDTALLFLDVFVQARIRLRSRALSNPFIPLEMAVARLAGLAGLESLGALAQRLEDLARGGAPAAGGKSRSSTAAELSTREARPAHPFEEPPTSGGEETVASAADCGTEIAAAAPSPADNGERQNGVKRQPDEAATVSGMSEIWRRIMAIMRQRHAGDLPYLRGVRPTLEGNDLVLHAPRASIFLREQLDDSDRRQRLAAVAAEVIGRPTAVRVAKPENSSVTAEHDAETISHKQRQAACDHPAVQMILRQVRGNIVEVREVKSGADEESA